MTLVALLAIASGAYQGTSGLTIEGQPVPLTFPAAPAPVDPAILSWHGLTYLNGAAGKMSGRYVVGHDWSPVQKAEAPKATAVPWRMRVVIFSETESYLGGTYGYAISARRSFEDTRLQQAKEALARLVSWVNFQTAGQVKLVPEVTVETETMRRPIEPDLGRVYFSPRINGGGYEAEDKIFRGPYQSAIFIVPGPEPIDLSPVISVNGTPTTGVAAEQIDVPYGPDSLDVQLHRAWQRTVEFRIQRRGFRANPSDTGTPTQEAWQEAASSADIPTDVRLQRLKDNASLSLGLYQPDMPSVTSAASAVTTASLATDQDRGQVLRYLEVGVGRSGGFALPGKADGTPLAKISETPTLGFWMKTASRDPLAVTLTDGTKSVTVSVRRGDVLGGLPESAVAFPDDGAWHHVAIDFKDAAAKAGLDSITGITVGPSPGTRRSGVRGVGAIEVFLDEFRFSSDKGDAFLADPQPNATSPSYEERAIFAAKATQTSPELIALLVDPVTTVRLNAADAYTRIKDNEAQPNLVKCVVDLNPAVASRAIKALMFQGGEIAMLTAKRLTAIGVTPLVRGTAVDLLGKTADPKLRPEIAAMLTDKSRYNRAAAARALGKLPGKDAAMVRMAFLDQTDPEVKLAVIQSSDPADDFQMRKLMWSAVNEPADGIRAASDIELLQSPDAATSAEGYKGVKDDSRAVRLIVLEWLAANPSEKHRNALRLAITDRSPEVRAAALRGFAALEKGAEPDEIANVVEDQDPEVMLALQELAKKRGFKLADNTRKLMAASPDERVRRGLSDIP